MNAHLYLQHRNEARDALLRAAATVNEGTSAEQLALAMVEAGRGLLHLVAMDEHERAKPLVLEALARAAAR